jgi:hypothetical protein
MVVILFFAITITNILKYGSAAGVSRGSLEGFDQESKKGSDEPVVAVDASGNASDATSSNTDKSASISKEDLAAQKELMTLQKDLLDKIKNMEPFIDKMTNLEEKMKTK